MWSQKVITEKIITNKRRVFRIIIFVSSVAFLYWFLYYSLTDFYLPPIEIRNDCKTHSDGSINGFICERKFDVSAYFEDFKKKVGEIYKSQTIAEKLAGASPELFRYSVGFEDHSTLIVWRNQHQDIVHEDILPSGSSRMICPFPEGFEERQNHGNFKEIFGISEIPDKVRELATALNDCQQTPTAFNEKVDKLEKAEKYDIFVKLSWPGRIWIGVLVLPLMSLILGILKSLYKFCKSGFDN